MCRKLLTAVIALFMVMAFTLDTPADDDKDDDKNEVNPEVFGNTYGEWAAEWWQWAYAGPDGENAIQDETGEFCDVNQPDEDVWFLAGSFGVPGIKRTCTIPAERALFYPLANSVWTDCPLPLNDEELTDEEVRAILARFGIGGDTACQLTSYLDGQPLLDGGVESGSISSQQILTVRTQSPVFSISPLPVGHILDPGCCVGFDEEGNCIPLTLPPGETDRRSIAEGHWVMLPPLSPGEHTLTLHGAGCDPETSEVFFETGVSYQLTVLDDDDGDDDDDD